MLEVPLDRRVEALLAVARAVAGAHEINEVLERAAEEALAILGVSTLSLSRWDFETGLLHTLINVGELIEDRWPQDEVYDPREFPAAHALLTQGRPHISHVDDPDCDPAERTLMLETELASCAAAPILDGDRLWGEMWVGNGPERLPLRPVDVQFMQAICSQVALAIGRAELYSQIVAAAYRDYLTGLANRRAFDERLATAVAGPVALLIGDLDGLKAFNDSAGHGAGDAALRAVGDALTGCTYPGVLAARIGGDEFCLILEGATRERAAAIAVELSERLAAGTPSVSVSWGVAAQDGAGTTADLMRAADAALYEAKRERGRRARALRGRRVAHDDLLREAIRLLDALEADPSRLAAAVAALQAV